MSNVIKYLYIIVLVLCTSCITVKDYYYQYNKYDLIKKNNLLFIELTLNKKPALFLIDTGATKSFLDINKYEKYGFVYIDFPIERYIGIGGMQDIYTVYGYDITEMFISVLGINLEELNPYFKSGNIVAAGIIGSDFLINRNAIIDYENLKLYLKKY